MDMGWDSGCMDMGWDSGCMDVGWYDYIEQGLQGQTGCQFADAVLL
jgi:hypothetical protein